jgi:hypothetical protein
MRMKAERVKAETARGPACLSFQPFNLPAFQPSSPLALLQRSD